MEISPTEVYFNWTTDQKNFAHFAIRKQDCDKILNNEGKIGIREYVDDISRVKKTKDRVLIETDSDMVVFTFRQNQKSIEKSVSFNELEKGYNRILQNTIRAGS